MADKYIKQHKKKASKGKNIAAKSSKDKNKDQSNDASDQEVVLAEDGHPDINAIMN